MQIFWVCFISYEYFIKWDPTARVGEEVLLARWWEAAPSLSLADKTPGGFHGRRGRSWSWTSHWGSRYSVANFATNRCWSSTAYEVLLRVSSPLNLELLSNAPWAKPPVSTPLPPIQGSAWRWWLFWAAPHSGKLPPTQAQQLLLVKLQRPSSPKNAALCQEPRSWQTGALELKLSLTGHIPSGLLENTGKLSSQRGMWQTYLVYLIVPSQVIQLFFFFLNKSQR